MEVSIHSKDYFLTLELRRDFSKIKSGLYQAKAILRKKHDPNGEIVQSAKGKPVALATGGKVFIGRNQGDRSAAAPQ